MKPSMSPELKALGEVSRGAGNPRTTRPPAGMQTQLSQPQLPRGTVGIVGCPSGVGRELHLPWMVAPGGRELGRRPCACCAPSPWASGATGPRAPGGARATEPVSSAPGVSVPLLAALHLCSPGGMFKPGGGSRPAGPSGVPTGLSIGTL